MKVYVYFETEFDLIDIYEEIELSELNLIELEEKVKTFEDPVLRVCIQPL